MPPSEHRLHPIALLLLLGRQVREAGFAIVAVLIFLRTGGDAPGAIGQAVGPLVGILLLLGPSVSKLVTYRYSYADDELVIRWGWLFRKVRHIPFTRIQSLDAREMLLHRWTGTVAVKVETGGGAETDGDIAAIPRAAFEEMRQRVTPDRPPAPTDDSVDGQSPAVTLAHLTTKDLILAGLINNRGMVVVAGLAAIVFEWGFGDQLLERLFGARVAEQGTSRTIFELLRGSIDITPQVVLVALLGIVAFIVAVRLMSLVFTVLRFHDHRLVKIGDDLRVSCGLLTRTTSTTPLHRIQTLTIREGPWHRLAGRVTVQAATAGGAMLAETVASRETLSPLMLRGQVPALVHVALDGVHLPEHGWQPAAPPSRRRALVRNLMIWIVPLTASWFVGTPALGLVLLCAVLSTIASLGRVARFEWVAFDGGLALRSGWLWRRTTVVRHNRIQLAALWQSPFDRRHDMATVEVDSAGSSAPTINLPWLMRHDALQLVARLDAGIAATEFSL